MGKNKSGSKKGASSSTPAKKCTCDHPYQCSCGNRPERPSKGHKWDPATQQWGGKGHKQKGASGQTATVAQAETVTAVGNVAVKQWQKLPSKLLADLCKKNSKEMGMPVYRPIGNRGAGGATGAGAGAGGGSGKYRFRLIVPSTVKTNNKGEHDVVLAPSLPVDNEEQAKEEAALLGLLFLFPKLPHERTLPEPYRSTYLVALKNNNNKNDNSNANDATDRSKYDDKIKTKASKNPQSATNTNSQVKNDFKSNKRNITSNNNTASSIQGATANTQLTANIPSFHQEKHSETKSRPSSGSSSEPQSTPILLTRAQRNEARLAHQREIQAKIRKHEAIRNANKPMEVFMSARFRKRIERLLTGDYGNEKESKEDDNCDTDEEVGDCIECEEEDVIQSYVIQRLVHEGFTKEQSRKAYRRVFGNTVLGSGSNGEEKEDAAAQDQQMDSAYEQTLQNLLIHSKEEDLPIGFDPRGGNLDVIIPTASAKGRKSGGNKSEIIGSGKSTGDSGRTASSDDFDADTIHFARHLGLTPNEAFAIISAGSSTLRTTDESFQKEERKEIMHKCLFWESICKAASFPTDQTCLSSLLSAIGMKSHNNAVDSLPDEEKQRNQEAASEELEALEAIFSPEEFSVRRYNLGGRKSENSTTIVSIAQTHPTSPESNLYLEIHYVNGLYPSLLPTCLITFGEWGAVSNWEYTCGANIHLKIIEFISTLTPGEECIFTLFGHLQSLLQDEDGWNSLQSEPSKLLSSLNVHGSVVDNNSTPLNQDTTSGCGEPNHVDVTKQHSKQQRTKIYRPREKNTFWNKSPRNTTPAEPFPKLPAVLDRARKSLPAAKARDEFLALLEAASTSGRVTLVTGETGCGKTTQIPQYILEANPKTAKIIVAQPRRLAATGVASRVALERGERSPGMGSIGYVVRGDSKLHADTRLVFCTTGVLLRQLQSDKALENISHIVIDEVHERHLDSDVLLAILKQTLPLNPSLKVILMSATMDADRFARYWGPNTPRMHIPGFTYPVRDFMLEDVLSITNYVPPKKRTKSTSGGRRYQIQSLFPDGEEGVDDDDEDLERNPAEQVPETRANACAVSLEERLSRMNENEIDYDLIAVLIETLLRSKKDDGSILVFLPGAGEIDRAEKTIQHVLSGRKITTLPLHGGLQPEHQQKVFIPANKGFTKIILSTNVAETSITIPDCTIVIDTCKEKQSSFDPINRMPLLLEQFASKDSLKQRRGRAGRVREGSCYKLITSSLYRSLPEHGEPEIRRCALDQSILSLLFLGLENGSGDFLRVMLDPPSKQSIQSAFDSLEKVGAVARSGDLLNLTPLGTHLAGIPAPPTVGKLIVMGYLLGCRDLAIDIAAGMSVGRSPFLRINTPFRNGHQGEQDPAVEKQERNNKRILEDRALLFKTVGNSDHALLGLISKLWDECRGAIDKRELCDRYGLNFNSMKEISQLVRQLDSSLNASGFVATEDSNKYENSWRIVRSAIVAALSPNQVVRVQRPTAKYTETVEGAVEKEGKAKDLKFFIRGGNYAEASGKSDSVGELFSSDNEERVFLHPSSSNFATGSFSCPWLVYHRLVRTSKAFISDSTECNPYALLLFGGTMEVEAAKGIITIDNWVKLSANARIGSLIGALRQKVDDLLEKKIANPSLDITNSTEMSLIRDLLRNDGLS